MLASTRVNLDAENFDKKISFGRYIYDFLIGDLSERRQFHLN